VVTGVPGRRGGGSGSGASSGAIERLRRMIRHRELLPGEQVRQEEMAELLGISRVPLREALRVLASEGLLTHRPQQGYFVTKLDMAQLEQMHIMLEFLEDKLIQTVEWPDEQSLDHIREINRGYVDAAGSGDLDEVDRRNRAFHVAVFSLSPHDLLLAEVQRFWHMGEPYRLLHVANTDAQIAAREHDRIIEALALRDRVLVIKVVAEHRWRTHDVAESLVRRTQPVTAGAAAG
jgi:DNA-binding GntR family transcriptional regulator